MSLLFALLACGASPAPAPAEVAAAPVAAPAEVAPAPVAAPAAEAATPAPEPATEAPADAEARAAVGSFVADEDCGANAGGTPVTKAWTLQLGANGEGTLAADGYQTMVRKRVRLDPISWGSSLVLVGPDEGDAFPESPRPDARIGRLVHEGDRWTLLLDEMTVDCAPSGLVFRAAP